MNFGGFSARPSTSQTYSVPHAADEINQINYRLAREVPLVPQYFSYQYTVTITDDDGATHNEVMRDRLVLPPTDPLVKFLHPSKVKNNEVIVVMRDCWYSAICMLAYYDRPGPCLGAPHLWLVRSGLPPSGFRQYNANSKHSNTFRKIRDFFSLGSLSTSYERRLARQCIRPFDTTDFLFDLLEQENLKSVLSYGLSAERMSTLEFAKFIFKVLNEKQKPIMARLYQNIAHSNQVSGHVVVIVGIGNGKIIYNDPGYYRGPREDPIEEFRRKVKRHPTALTVRDNGF